MTNTITANNNNNLISTEIFTSTGNNFLIDTNSDTEVLALAGNDTVVIGPKVGVVSDFTIQAGEGNDSIQLEPGLGLNNSEIYGGQGNDTIRIAAITSNTFIQTLSGDNIVEITASVADSTIQTGDGADLIRQNPAVRLLRTTVRTGAGNDLLNLQTVEDSTVFLGSGNDSATFTGLNTTLNIPTIAVEGSTVQSLTGNNTVTVGAGVPGGPGARDARNSAFEFGDGNDVLTITGVGDQIVVRAGAGNDSVTIDSLFALALPSVTTGSQINLGQGDDTVVFTGVLGGLVNSRVQTLSGDNRFQLGTGTNFDLAISGALTSITAGDGADTIAMVDDIFGNTAETFFGANTISGIETLSLLANPNGVPVNAITVGANVQGAGIETVLIEDQTNGGTINVTAGFTGDLVGSAVADTFTFTNAAVLTGVGSIDGLGGDDSIVLNTTGQNVTDAAFEGVTSVENLVLANGDNTVTFGTNAAAANLTTVEMTGANSDDTNVLVASGVTNITGSDANDDVTADAALQFVNFTQGVLGPLLGSQIDNLLTFTESGVDATVWTNAAGNDSITLFGAAGTGNSLTLGAPAGLAAGSTVITGALSNDTVVGGINSDTITTGGGNDVLTGGTGGANTFTITNDLGAGTDGVRITDFRSGTDSVTIGASLLAGNYGTFAANPGQLNSVNTATFIAQATFSNLLTFGASTIAFSGATFNTAFAQINFATASVADYGVSTTLQRQFRVLFLDTAGANAGLYILSGNANYSTGFTPGASIVANITGLQRQTVLAGSVFGATDISFI